MQIKVESFAQQGKTAARISDSFRVGGPEEREDVLWRGQYRIVERDSCEHVQPGVYVDDSPHSGKDVHICAEADCPVHSGVSRYATPEQPRDRKDRTQDQRTDRLFRALLLEEIRRKLGKVARKDDVCMVAAAFLARMTHHDRVALFKTYKWDATKSPGKHGGKHVDYAQIASRHLANMGVAELMQFLVLASLTPDLSIPASNSQEALSPKSALAEAAKRHGLDLKDLRKRAATQSGKTMRPAK